MDQYLVKLEEVDWRGETRTECWIVSNLSQNTLKNACWLGCDMLGVEYKYFAGQGDRDAYFMPSTLLERLERAGVNLTCSYHVSDNSSTEASFHNFDGNFVEVDFHNFLKIWFFLVKLGNPNFEYTLFDTNQAIPFYR